MIGAYRLLGLAASLGLSATITAPLQCARTHPIEHRVEDDPAEVLYTLADTFKAEGNAAARTETLRFLLARYPESRFAAAARADLGEPALAPTGHPTPGP
jgi:hypothetical protein